jgi:hypothetical protein
MGSTTYPDTYANEYVQRCFTRWSAPIGTYIRQFAPTFFPGAPPEAFIAFTGGAASGADDTASNPNSGFGLHEIGYFSVPAGDRNQPAASGASGDDWSQLARDPMVRTALGRNAVTGPTAWQNAPADQAAVGLAMLRSVLGSANAHIPANVRATGYGSLWAVAVSFCAFSAGPGSTSTRIGLYPQLAQYNEDLRWGAWLYLQAADIRAGQSMGAVGNHNNRAYTLCRTWQKLALGRELAKLTGGDVAWFDSFGLSAADYTTIQEILSIAGMGVGANPGNAAIAPPSASLLGPAATLLATAGLAAAVAYVGWKYVRGEKLWTPGF